MFLFPVQQSANRQSQKPASQSLHLPWVRLSFITQKRQALFFVPKTFHFYFLTLFQIFLLDNLSVNSQKIGISQWPSYWKLDVQSKNPTIIWSLFWMMIGTAGTRIGAYGQRHDRTILQSYLPGCCCCPQKMPRLADDDFEEPHGTTGTASLLSLYILSIILIFGCPVL